MLERIAYPDATVYQSPLLRDAGVPHAFGTRHGDTDAIARALGLDQHHWATVKQVHGCAVSRTGNCDADAVVLDNPAHATRIITADCIPVLLASLDGQRVAAIHAGWRGLVAGVIERAAEALDAPFLAAVGPCISAAHFEVGPEVAQHFDPAHITPGTQVPDANPHVDLAGAAAALLSACEAIAIDRTDRCTYHDSPEFYSHRRDVTHQGADTTGRMTHIIAPKQ